MFFVHLTSTSTRPVDNPTKVRTLSIGWSS